ncbi:LuxR C-terminal-related transcriptional regulator [Herbiconiux sp. KACC 21604]|uniref:helix-turn-helix transcriptional regulator n=1 Tax=unclassified Herbiconiux TaxID=2618217 RepID=UPI0014927707|nr:LuxR family transcriptional regulator [Herbiconiux sp. SALV-R1]QJU53572.1 hypothetical protein HL652_07965 [Herbiconiux sp. SALV-R1]WPO88553.1 LuxR C-terminal-related transcriptional regulator [Herbiconiux sp. KACC 21604]
MTTAQTTHDPDRFVCEERVVAELAADRGVILVGERGSGRTHLMRRVIQRLDDKTRRRLWVGDDVDRLMPAQAEKLVEAVKAGSVLPLLAARTRTVYPVVDELRRAGAVTRVELPALDGAATLQVAERFVGGVIDDSAVPAFVPQRGGGDLVILREALREARSSGALVSDGDGWRLAQGMPRYEELRAVIMQRSAIIAMGTDVEQTLDLICLAPGLGVDRLRSSSAAVSDGEPVSAHFLEQLESEGVIEVRDDDGELRLRMRDPVVELLLPQTLGRLRHRRLCEALVDTLAVQPSEALGSVELVTLARLSLVMGRPVDPVALTAAAELALRTSRTELAHGLASLALAHGAGSAAELILTSAESQLGRWTDALARVQALEIDELEVSQLRAREELFRLISDRLDGANPHWGLVEKTDSQASEQNPVSPVQLNTMALSDEASSAPARPAGVAEAAAVLEGERLAISAAMATLRGQLTTALSLADEAEQVLLSANADPFRARFERIFASAYDLPLDTTISRATALAAEAGARGHGGQQSLAEWMAGIVTFSSGRSAAAVVLLRRALTELARHGHVETGLLARAGLCMALAAAGRPDEAAATLAPLELVSQGQPFLEGWTKQAQAWIEASSGRREAAATMFRAAAEAHREDGLFLSSIVASVEAVRAGAGAEALEGVDTLAPLVEGRCIDVALQFARAMAALLEPGVDTSDPDGVARALALESAGEASATIGLHAYAAEAYSRASRLHAAAARSRDASSAARRADEAIRLCDTPAQLFLSEVVTSPLSSRELEVARLASTGMSNREVADVLVLSIRTVETHMLRIFRKLGIRSRSELSSSLTAATGAPAPLAEAGIGRCTTTLHHTEHKS